MSIGEALAVFDHDEAARVALSKQVDELFAEFAMFMGDLGVPLTPIYDAFEARRGPIWRMCWVASDHYGHVGSLTLVPNGPGMHYVPVVDESGQWHVVGGVPWGLTTFGCIPYGDIYYRSSKYREGEKARRQVWQPGGVPITARWKADINGGLLYPVVTHQVVGQTYKRRPPLEEMLLRDYLANAVRSARERLGSVDPPGTGRHRKN